MLRDRRQQLASERRQKQRLATRLHEDRAALRSEINRLRPRSMSADEYAAVTNAGLAEDHIGRFREYAEAGVHTAIVNLTGAPDPGAVEGFGEVIQAFR